MEEETSSNIFPHVTLNYDLSTRPK